MINATDVKLVDNVFVKMMHLKAIGDVHAGHAHTFDHITLLATGKVNMKHDSGEQEFTAPQLIVTPKGITHQFVALSNDVLLCCVHAIRDGSTVDDVAKQDLTPEEAAQLLQQFPLTQSEQ
jgi:quercetin dioxygenase-like cupin family protein